MAHVARRFGLAARCTEVVQNDVARGCLLFDTGGAYARRHLFCGASVDKVSLPTPPTVDVSRQAELTHSCEELTTSYKKKGAESREPAQLTGVGAHDAYDQRTMLAELEVVGVGRLSTVTSPRSLVLVRWSLYAAATGLRFSYLIARGSSLLWLLGKVGMVCMSFVFLQFPSRDLPIAGQAREGREWRGFRCSRRTRKDELGRDVQSGRIVFEAAGPQVLRLIAFTSTSPSGKAWNSLVHYCPVLGGRITDSGKISVLFFAVGFLSLVGCEKARGAVRCEVHASPGLDLSHTP